ncbi:STAS domain-containing protein [Novipirellula rosea]|uniref:STAS domain-containing protein n=1 Tax=Novipirellula rosea TaxID=1031540 RepID=UPI0031E97C34
MPTPASGVARLIAFPRRLLGLGELPAAVSGDNLLGETANRRAPAFRPSILRKHCMSAITTQVVNDILLVGFTDSKILDSQRIEQVGRELQESVPQAVHKKMLLNFRGVSFMSSAMITKLVMLNKSCKAQGVSLKFCEVSPNVMEVFKITKLNKLFDIQEGEEKAMASFDKKGWFG